MSPVTPVSRIHGPSGRRPGFFFRRSIGNDGLTQINGVGMAPRADAELSALGVVRMVPRLRRSGDVAEASQEARARGGKAHGGIATREDASMIVCVARSVCV